MNGKKAGRYMFLYICAAVLFLLVVFSFVPNIYSTPLRSLNILRSCHILPPLCGDILLAIKRYSSFRSFACISPAALQLFFFPPAARSNMCTVYTYISMHRSQLSSTNRSALLAFISAAGDGLTIKRSVPFRQSVSSSVSETTMTFASFSLPARSRHKRMSTCRPRSCRPCRTRKGSRRTTSATTASL